MGDRRMLTKKVTDDDHFMTLSSSAQALYLHLTMSADDDGFCNSVTMAMFKAHASVQDLEALLKMKYLLQFDDGVIVIKHWRMANAIRKDRYTPTSFQEEYKKLGIKENGSYTLNENWLPSGCQVVATSKDKLSKDKLSKDKLSKDIYDDSTESKPAKKHYGEFQNVLLTDAEYEKLAAEFDDLDSRIERLSEYIASKGKRYKSHYATIKTWARNDKKEEMPF